MPAADVVPAGTHAFLKSSAPTVPLRSTVDSMVAALATRRGQNQPTTHTCFGLVRTTLRIAPKDGFTYQMAMLQQ